MNIRVHGDAVEKYIDVEFSYPAISKKWEGTIPFHYRYSGLLLQKPKEVADFLEDAYGKLSPEKRAKWARHIL